LAVIGARMGVSLPYFRADMRMRLGEKGFEYDSQRWSVAGPPAAFSGTYRGVGPVSVPPPGSLDHFLTERYCLYTVDERTPFRAEIHHPPWQLEPAEGEIELNTMPPPGLALLDQQPLLHFAERQDVLIWPLGPAA